MAVYESRFATKGVAPAVRGKFRATKKIAVGVGIAALLAAGAFGLWRATLGIPDPGPVPPGTVTIAE